MHQIHCTTKLYKGTKKYHQYKDLESNLNEMYAKMDCSKSYIKIMQSKKDISIVGIYFKLKHVIF